MRVGVLYMGNESNRICGGGVISHYLIQAFEVLGHEAWRASATEKGDVSDLPPVDVLISEGVPDRDIPPVVRQKCRRIVFWWLSQLFYDEHQIAEAGFDGIATNSHDAAQRLCRRGVRAHVVDLAASPLLASACPRDEYRTPVTYVGNYPHKRQEQLDAMLLPAVPFGLSVWGRGWHRSAFRDSYRGILPLLDIGPLYRSADAVLAITEDRQRNMGMVNNRIFEAIAAGAVVISEPHPFLANHELGRFVHFTTGPEMVRDVLERLRVDPSLRELAAEGQRCVLANHTYRQRAEEFVRFFEELEH
jgi:Glycosyl transferases group 1